MARHITVLLALSLSASACTNHLQSVQVSAADANTRRGAPYSLQFTQYEITLTHQVAECGNPLRIVPKAEVKVEAVDDGDHTYVIPLNSMISPMKVSELKVQYVNGKLSAVNASAEDRTAQTILAGAQGIGKLVRVGLTGGVVGAGARTLRCTDEVRQALIDRKDAKKTVEDLGKELERLTAEMTREKATYTASGNDPAVRTRLSGAINLVDGKSIEVEAAKKQLDRVNELLTFKETFRWPETSSEFVTKQPRLIPASALAQWLTLRPLDGETTASPAYVAALQNDLPSQLADKAKEFGVALVIEKVGNYGRNPAKPEEADTGNPNDGLRFRVPASGKLVICKLAACSSTDADKVVAVAPGPVLQLGLIFYAPFSSPPFTNGAFEASFDEGGRPKVLGLGRKSASAETIASLAKELGTEAATLYAAINKTPAERQAEELLALENEKKLAVARAALDPNAPANQLAILEAQKKLEDARATLPGSPTYELARLTAIAESERKYNDAIKALAIDPNSDAKLLKTTLEADAAALTAEKNYIEAQIALQDARRRLQQ